MIREKREELELFLRSQTLGPGISGYRFVCLDDADVMANDLLKFSVTKYNQELLNIVPAAVYSTGILFPVDDSMSLEALTPLNDREHLTAEENAGDQDTDGDIIEEEDSIRIDQMFPNIMGMTCCFDDAVLGRDDLVINVSARYYDRVVQDELFNQNYGVLCELDVTLFNTFLLSHGLEPFFSIVQKESNYIVLFRKQKNEKLKEIRILLRAIADRNASAINDELRNEGYSFGGKNPSALKQSLFYELKFKAIDETIRRTIYDASQRIELVENMIGHLVDLLDINDRGYGLWRAHVVNIDLPFPGSVPTEIKGKMIYSFSEKSKNYCSSLKDVYENKIDQESKAALSVNLQLSRDSRRDNNSVFLKVQLVNTSTHYTRSPGDSRYYSTFNEVVNQRSFFGVKLGIANNYLQPYNGFDINIAEQNSDEDLTTKFIYRQFEDYGVGHGCSVKWQTAGMTKFETEYIPTCDTPDIDTVPKDKEFKTHSEQKASGPLPDLLPDTTSLQFKWLSTFSQATDLEVIAGLNAFIDAYGNWISVKRAKYQGQKLEERTLVSAELDKCTTDKDRMSNNINDFLTGPENQQNMRSFRLMNSSMFMQLWHSENVKKNTVLSFMNDVDFQSFDQEFYRASSVIFNQRPAAWRAFQLAFIILNLDGIFKRPGDEVWKERNELVDLVWFPTGGGKTEAYLGLISLTIINRRIIHGAIGGGTAAIMRYTLRLLTQQQFTRATLLIMALESIRRWGFDRLGAEPIYIGLWVGEGSLPNDLDGLKEEYGKLNRGIGTKIPFEHCPWCRSPLIPMLNHENDRSLTFEYNRLHLFCTNEKCSFCQPEMFNDSGVQGPLPVELCDDIIYQHPPALLFGTVDKFAQLAHKVTTEQAKRHKDSRRLFGQGNWESGKPNKGYFPPDLIIQDELHLLLGPLGSSVALFESAVDQLCTRADGTRPKVISSTATTRNTQLQIMALFDRRVNLFPKPGVECDDSFFAFYKRKTSYIDNGVPYDSKRRYLGILPTGRTQIWMQMRIAAIFMTHRAVFELIGLQEHCPLDTLEYGPSDRAMDYYHTIISYFNSLKEVGKTESQIHTYLSKEIRRVFNRVVRPKKLMHCLYTYSIRSGELTGRLSGEEVKNELHKVQSEWKPAKRFAHIGTKNQQDVILSGGTPPDFVVATNMISVGIDVSRFNSMIINSMPRNVAEYIQASSRVARESYGMVITIHHPFRARDVSHYEKFIEFHEKMYSYVEPISITPFTKKAIDRYMGLYLATMLRHSHAFPDRRNANTILQYSSIELEALKDHLSDYFLERMNRLMRNENDPLLLSILTQDNVDQIIEWMAEAIEDWKVLAETARINGSTLVFNNKRKVANQSATQEQLYVEIDEYNTNIHSEKWQIPMSLRVIEPAAALKIKLK
ncbi:MAG: helicase-related protein [Pedobacter sp.]